MSNAQVLNEVANDETAGKAQAEKAAQLQKIQSEYTKACAEYGHLKILTARTQERMGQLEAMINNLDAAAAKLRG